MGKEGTQLNRKRFSIPIAVIGMGCRYPGSSSPRQLWENVLGRRRQFRRMPDCRMPLADYYHEDVKTPDKSYARQAAVIDGFEFDWSAHRIPKSTYEATDIVHWLALDTALQAIADAGFNADDFPGRRTGVIVGNTLTGEQTRSNSLRARWPYHSQSFPGGRATMQNARRGNAPIGRGAGTTLQIGISGRQ